MPIISFEKVLKIIQTILNVLVAALSAIGGFETPKDEENV